MKSNNITITLIMLCLLVIISNSSYPLDNDSGYIKSGNGKIYYETSGTGEVIILIHDGLLPGAVWDEQFSFFSEDFRVIRYDRRGYPEFQNYPESQ